MKGINLCGVRLKNPLILSSGCLGVSAGTLIRIAKAGAGAITSKTSTLKPRAGHKNPSVLAEKNFIINSVGLSNKGVEEEIKKLKRVRREVEIPIIASIFGESIEEFGKIAERISEAEPDIIEVNISCPNVRGEVFWEDAKSAGKVVKKVKSATSIPIFVKLSPNVKDIKEVAKSVEYAGADGITAINTVRGMVFSAEERKPILANKFGGISGPAIKPIALRCVYEISQVVDIPIIGVGGVCTGRDALEMLSAGASAVGICSAVYFRGISVFRKILKEMEEIGWK